MTSRRPRVIRVDFTRLYGLCGCRPGLDGAEEVFQMIRGQRYIFSGVSCCLEQKIAGFTAAMKMTR